MPHLPIARWLALAALLAVPAAATAAPQIDTARLSKIHKMSQAQFAAVERVYVAALPLDKFRKSGAGSLSAANAASRKALNACLKLSTSDPLLRALRAGCPALADLSQETDGLNSCTQAACLKTVLNATRTKLREARDGSRTSDRGVHATHLARACKHVLLTPGSDYVAYAKFDKGFAKLAHALDTGSKSELNAAQRLINAADKEGAKAPTAKTSLRRLRAHCVPLTTTGLPARASRV
jgi:hypothetical protein